MLITTYYAVIGDEITYRIGLLLSRYVLSVTELSAALELPQPRISHKLAKLRKHGCVNHERDGRRVIYRFLEPCRTILLRGDLTWRRLNPEFNSRWQDDQRRLARILGSEINDRLIYPLVEDLPNGMMDPQPADSVLQHR